MRKRSRRTTVGPQVPLYDSYRGLYTPSQLAKIKQFLLEEGNRSFKHLVKEAKPKPSYLSYLFRNERTERLFGRLGAIAEHNVESQNFVYCDLRVGTYKYDNVSQGGLTDNSDESESIDYLDMPAEINEDAFKYALWKLTDARYREAAEQYYERKSKELHYVDQTKRQPSREKAKGNQHWKPQDFPEVDLDYYRYLLRKAGELIKKYTRIQNSWVEFKTKHRQSIFTSTEGSAILRNQSVFALRAFVWLLNKKGEAIEQYVNCVEGSLDNLPSEKEFLAAVKDRIDTLFLLEKAPLLNAYTGPVLMSGEAAGLFFHEVVGHRLEGSRLLSTEEGATFRDLRGKRICPPFIDIVDNPTIPDFEGKKLIGHFLYDDEGSAAKRAILVERGELKSFLTTRTPLPGQKNLNGHARNEKHERPISRMGNLFIINHEPIAEETLREMFLEEIRKQNKPYGIRIHATLGGETGTSSYDFQAFKGDILSASMVFPNGKEKLVRGVDFIGTPLSALDSVLAMGSASHVENSYCGAESGMVPVSTISPSLLMKNLELQGKDRERITQYSIPLPYDH